MKDYTYYIFTYYILRIFYLFLTLMLSEINNFIIKDTFINTDIIIQI